MQTDQRKTPSRREVQDLTAFQPQLLDGRVHGSCDQAMQASRSQMYGRALCTHVCKRMCLRTGADEMQAGQHSEQNAV